MKNKLLINFICNSLTFFVLGLFTAVCLIFDEQTIFGTTADFWRFLTK